MSKWLSRPETMIGLSAVLLSVCGLFISMYEARLLRAHQRASVWPHVEVTPSLRTDGVTLMVRNTGVGPARIEAAAVTVNGERHDNWEAVIRRVLDEPARVNAYHSLINGRVLPAAADGEVIFEVGADGGGAGPGLLTALRDEIMEGNLDVELCYCSVYDECWTTRMQDVVNRLRGAGVERSREVNDCRRWPTSGI